jgi:hypothetical protein
MESKKQFRRHLLLSGVLSAIFVLFQLMAIPFSGLEINAGLISERLLACLLVIIIGQFIYAYIYYGRKYYEKHITKTNFAAWSKYTFLWGVFYTGIGMPITILLIVFSGFSLILPLNISFTNTVDFLKTNFSLFYVCITSGFVYGNIVFIKEIIKHKFLA